MVKVLVDLPSRFKSFRQAINIAINGGQKVTLSGLKAQLLVEEDTLNNEQDNKNGEALLTNFHDKNKMIIITIQVIIRVIDHVGAVVVSII